LKRQVIVVFVAAAIGLAHRAVLHKTGADFTAASGE
jgi:hypothetical protein